MSRYDNYVKFTAIFEIVMAKQRSSTWLDWLSSIDKMNLFKCPPLADNLVFFLSSSLSWPAPEIVIKWFVSKKKNPESMKIADN